MNNVAGFGKVVFLAIIIFLLFCVAVALMSRVVDLAANVLFFFMPDHIVTR